MALLAFIGDLHLDAAAAGVERATEVREFVEAAAADMVRRGVLHAVLLGDYYDPGSPQDPRWARLLAELVATLLRAVPGRVVALAGNHDVQDVRASSAPTSTLSALACVAENAGAGLWSRLSVVEEPAVGDLDDGEGSLVELLALPYVSRAAGDYGSLLAPALAAVREARARRGRRPLVAAGHLMFRGATPGSEVEVSRGRDVQFPAEEVAALEPDLVVNAHYHRPQTIRAGKLAVLVPGAAIRVTFGEDDDEPRGYLVAEV